MTTESNVRSDPRGTPPRSGLDAYFHISERGSTVEREIRGGFATFFTMAYIVVLNPLILGGAEDVNGQRLDLGPAHHRDRPGGGGHDAVHGGVRPLPVRDRGRPRA